MANFVRPFEKWIAEGVASKVNDFSTQAPEISKVGNMWKLPLISKKSINDTKGLEGRILRRAKASKGQGRKGPRSKRMANCVRPFEKWIAEGVASKVNDFTVYFIQLS